MGAGASVHVYSESRHRSAGQSDRSASLSSAVRLRLSQEIEGSVESAPSQPSLTMPSSSISDAKAVESSTINVAATSDVHDVASIPTISIEHAQQTSRPGRLKTRGSAYSAAGRKFFASSRSRWSRSPSPSPAPISRPMVRLVVQGTSHSYTLVSTSFDEIPTCSSAAFPKESVTTLAPNIYPPSLPRGDHPLNAGGTQLEEAQAIEV